VASLHVLLPKYKNRQFKQNFVLSARFPVMLPLMIPASV